MGRFDGHDDLLDRLISQTREANWRDDIEYDKELEAERLEEHINKLQAVGAVYGRTDRILTAEPVEVRVEDDKEMDTTAYNDGKNIVFNAHLIEDIDDKTIISLNGFNYHEVGHILYTPRGGSEFGKTVKREQLGKAFNVLEDARIERLLIAKYPSVAPFMEASCLEYLLKGDSAEFGSYFPLFTGRKYLDIELRQEIADRFIKDFGVDLAVAIATIVHEYRTLVYPRDFNRGLDLLRAFADIIGHENTNEVNGKPIIPNGNGGHTDREVQDKGRMKGDKEQKAQQDKATNNESGDGAGNERLDDPADTNTDNDRSSTSFGSKGKDEADDNVLRKDIQERLDNLSKNDEVQRTTKEVRKAINDNNERRSAIKQGAYSNQQVSAQVSASARAFGVALERVRIDNDPAWELEQPMGRLNIGRAMRADINDMDKVFDRWSEGNSNNDIDAIVLVDTSGSMSWQIQRTMESAWVIKRGIERINGRVSVYKFNHDSRLIYSATDKAKPTEYRYVNSSGGTNPYKALLEARRHLMNSKRGVRMLFIVTDGEWDMDEENNKVIADLTKDGVQTSVVYLGSLKGWGEFDREEYENRCKRYRHGAKHFREVEEPNQMVLVAKDIVKATMSARH
jgi:Mg-chelatase subunit ChlD